MRTGMLGKINHDGELNWEARFNKNNLMVSGREEFNCAQCSKALKEGKFWYIDNSLDPFMFCSEECYNLFKLKE